MALGERGGGRRSHRNFSAMKCDSRWRSLWSCERDWAARSVLGSRVGIRRLFHLSLFLTASRMVCTQDPSASAGRGGVADLGWRTHARAAPTRAAVPAHGALVLLRALVAPAACRRAAGSVLGSWVGARRPFHLFLLLTASRMDFTQDPSTNNPGSRVSTRILGRRTAPFAP